MREKKKSFLSVPTQSGVGNSKKIAKKIQKIKKLQYSFFKSENGTGLAENQKKKKNYRYDPFQHDPE